MDLTGKKFNRLTALYRDPDDKRYWICKCDCGNESRALYSHLLNGKRKSCGCLQKKKKDYSDVIGKRYGRWTVIERVDKGDNKRYFLCRCDCGTERVVILSALKNGSSRSCGCLRAEENAEKYAEKLKSYQKDFMDTYNYKGTMITSFDQKKSKNNTSGVKGVSKQKNGRYRAYINLKRKQIHLGIFDTLEEAKEARLEAEKVYFEPIVEEWKNRDK